MKILYAKGLWPNCAMTVFGELLACTNSYWSSNGIYFATLLSPLPVEYNVTDYHRREVDWL